MRLTGFIALALIILSACSGGKPTPEGVIAIQPMQRIVWDIIQADEAAMQNKFADSAVNLKTESFRLYDQVFSIHKISRQQFYKSYEYYQQRPQLYRALMNGVKTIADKDRKTSTQSRQ